MHWRPSARGMFYFFCNPSAVCSKARSFTCPCLSFPVFISPLHQRCRYLRMAQFVRAEVCDYSLMSGQRATRVGEPLGLSTGYLSQCLKHSTSGRSCTCVGTLLLCSSILVSPR